MLQQLLQKFILLPKPARSAHTVENSHSFFQCFLYLVQIFGGPLPYSHAPLLSISVEFKCSNSSSPPTTTIIVSPDFVSLRRPTECPLLAVFSLGPLVNVFSIWLKNQVLSVGFAASTSQPTIKDFNTQATKIASCKIFLTSNHSIYVRTVSSQCLQSALMNWFKLVYGLFGQSTVSSQGLQSALMNWFKLVYGLFGQSNLHS